MARELAAGRDRVRRELGSTQILPDLAQQGQRAAEQLAEGLRRTFTERAQQNARDLANKVIDEREAARRGRQAGDALNAGLISAMRELSRRGLLTPELQAQLTAQFENAGRPIGKRTVEVIAQEIAARNDIARALDQTIQDAGPSFLSAVGDLAQAAGQRLQSLGRALSLSVTAPLTAIAGVSVTAAVGMERLELGLNTITGSAEETARQLERLREVAKLPGLSFQEVVQGATNLQVLGFSAEQAEETIRRFGNAIALTGGGVPELQRVITQLTQMASAGKILTADLRPIIQTAPAVGQALQKAFGTIDAQAISDQLEAAGVGFEGFLDTVLAQLGQLPQAVGGLGNSLESLRDDLFVTRAAIGDELAPAVGLLVDQAGALLGWIRDLDPATKQWAISIGVAAAAIGPLAAGAGALAIALGALGGPVAVGVTAALAGIAALWVKSKLSALEATQAVDDYMASLQRMGAGDLENQAAELARQKAEIVREISRLEGLLQRVGEWAGPDLPRKLEAQRANLHKVEQALLAVWLATQKLNSETGGGGGGGAAEPFEKVVEALSKEIGLLTEARKLGVARADDGRRLLEIEQRLSREMGNGNRSLADRVAVARELARIQIRIEFDQDALETQMRGVREQIQDALDREFETQVRVEVASVHGGAVLNARQRFQSLGIDTSARDSGFFGGGVDPAVIRRETEERQKAIESFNQNVQAANEMVRAFGDLANATGDLSEETRRAISALGTIASGAIRLREGQELGGFAGAAATGSAFLSISAGVIGFIDTIRFAGAEARRARAETQKAIEEWAASLSPRDEIAEARSRQASVFAGFASGFLDDLQALFFAAKRRVPEWIADALGDPATLVNRRAELQELAASGDAIMSGLAGEMLKLLDIYDQHIAATQASAVAMEAAAQAALALSAAVAEEDLGVRLLRAQGLDSEADLQQFLLNQKRERERFIEDFQNLPGFADLLNFFDTVQAAEMQKFIDDRLKSEIAAAEAARDAAREAAEYAERARISFLDLLEIDELKAAGDEIGAQVAQLNAARRDRLQSAMDLGMDQSTLDRINALYDRLIANLLAGGEDASRAVRQIASAREEMNAVTRSVANISMGQAGALIDIEWAQLAVLQSIDGKLGGGATFGGGGGQTTVYDTGAETHVHYHIGPVNVAGSVVGIPDITRAIIADVDRELGGLNTDAVLASGAYE